MANSKKPIKNNRRTKTGSHPSKIEESASTRFTIYKIIEHYLFSEIVGLLSIFIAIFIVLANFNQAGSVGQILQSGLVALFGKAHLFLSLIALLIGISWLAKITSIWKISNTISLLIIFLTLVGFSQLLFQNGGWVGGKIFRLEAFIGKWGLTVFLLVLDVLALSILAERPVIESILALKAKAQKAGANETAQESTESKPTSFLKRLKLPRFWLKSNKNETKIVKTNNQKEKKKIEVKQKLPIKSVWQLPPLNLLEAGDGEPQSGDIKNNIQIIQKTLEHFSIPIEVTEVTVGPTVTRYAIKPAEGIKIAKITALQNDLALSLAATSIRIESPIPGKSLIGIEVPNKKIATVKLRPLLETQDFWKDRGWLTFPIGRVITGEPLFADLTTMPHLLIAGTTGSGKSMFIHSIINAFLFKNTPETLGLILVDPKRVELIRYETLPHLIMEPVLDNKKTVLVMQWLIREMESRYVLFQEHKVRDLQSYNRFQLQRRGEILPRIVLFIDEMADLMLSQGNVIEAMIVRLTQMARATGIHLILATQRPSVDVVTGLIKANIPNRICFKVASQVDSRTVLDTIGAEKLIGAGDMLFMSYGFPAPKRLQAPLITENEIHNIVSFWEKQKDKLGYERPAVELKEQQGLEFLTGNDEENDDELLSLAYKLVVETGKASTSFLQRKLKIGYARAARLLDLLEEKGIVGPAEGSKPRKVLIGTDTSSNENTLNSENDFDEFA
jgi:S-DNA-T family DNA segregation ATPase FtsK/SpoIIIE